MNITPKNWKKSEVTEQKERVEVGTKLTYCDSCNFQRWTVTEKDGDLITIVTEDGFEEYKDLDALQIGWEFSQTYTD